MKPSMTLWQATFRHFQLPVYMENLSHPRVFLPGSDAPDSTLKDKGGPVPVVPGVTFTANILARWFSRRTAYAQALPWPRWNGLLIPPAPLQPAVNPELHLIPGNAFEYGG